MMAEKVQVFEVIGMDCADCAKKVASGVQKLPGVQLSELNLATRKLTVVGESSPEAIRERVRALGYDLAATNTNQKQTNPRGSSFLSFLWKRAETRFAMLGALLILPGLILNEFLGQVYPWVNWFSLAAILAAGWPVVRGAWQNLRINHSIDINFLMSIAAIGAFIIGAYTEAGMVMVLFALGEALEGFTSERAHASIESLLDIVPQTATRIIGGNGSAREITLPVIELAVGDQILVRPGETIPMDGQILQGSSSVNQAAITGESALLNKQAGDEVFASSINGESALLISVTQLSNDNTISRVVKMVREAQEKQAPAQRFIDQFARWYTPLVVALASLTAIIPPILFQQPFLNPAEGESGWLYRGLTLLVISCPCALVISTPVSIISAISNAARHGVLFKGGLHLETLSKARVFAFDKTGTLTEGRPIVQSARSQDHRTFMPISGSCQDCSELVALAHAVERHSQHPLAQAVAQAAEKLGVAERYPAAMQVTVTPGKGVSGDVGGRLVQIGSHRWIDDGVQHSRQECDDLREMELEGSSQINIAVDGVLQGSLLAVDTPRETSHQALADLRKMGIQHLVMLTGDQPTSAQQIAQSVGVTDFRSQLLPQDKLSAVRDLQRQFGSIVMVGDGINDAPAMTLADVGIAVRGANSSALAMESADITLMQADLAQLPFALNLSRTAMNTIRFNIAFAIGVKAIFMLLALVGLSTMWMAVAADMGVSILVTLNGIRLLRQPD
jgi:Cd2+/Zn2+-exporting ATPase